MSCHHSVDTWVEVGFGRPVDDPAVPGMLEKYTRVFEDAVRLMADAFDVDPRRGALRVRARCLHRGRRPGLVPAARGLPRRLLPEVRRAHGRRAAHRDAPRVADDAADPAPLGHPGLLHHADRRRPVHLLQAPDLPEAGHRLLVRRVLRPGRHDRHRHAGAQRRSGRSSPRLRASSPAPTFRCERSPAGSRPTSRAREQRRRTGRGDGPSAAVPARLVRRLARGFARAGSADGANVPGRADRRVPHRERPAGRGVRVLPAPRRQPGPRRHGGRRVAAVPVPQPALVTRRSVRRFGVPR